MDTEIILQPIFYPKNGFSDHEQDILIKMGLLDFATQVNWQKRISEPIIQELLLNLNMEATTTKLEEKYYELIPANFRNLFESCFQIHTTPAKPNMHYSNQLLVSKS